MTNILRRIGAGHAVAWLGALLLVASPAAAQIQEVDPNEALSGESVSGGSDGYGDAASSTSTPTSTDDDFGEFPETSTPAASSDAAASTAPADDVTSMPSPTSEPTAGNTTYQQDDLIGAAEGVFGKGAKGLAGAIEDILRKQGEPNGYIVGRETSGAFIFGLRYGSGTLHHKIEGERPVYWTGPSVGFDAGANAGNTFVLVYNLYDSQDLYHRYGAGEGAAYLAGGFHISYLRRGDVVLIPVRMGLGLRLGANLGYMKFSEKQRWLPF